MGFKFHDMILFAKNSIKLLYNFQYSSSSPLVNVSAISLCLCSGTNEDGIKLPLEANARSVLNVGRVEVVA